MPKQIRKDDIATEPLPPGWQDALECWANRIKESKDEEVLNKIIEEAKK